MYCNYEIGKQDLIFIMVSLLAISMKPVNTLIKYSTAFTMVSLIAEPITIPGKFAHNGISLYNKSFKRLNSSFL